MQMRHEMGVGSLIRFFFDFIGILIRCGTRLIRRGGQVGQKSPVLRVNEPEDSPRKSPAYTRKEPYVYRKATEIRPKKRLDRRPNKRLVKALLTRGAGQMRRLLSLLP